MDAWQIDANDFNLNSIEGITAVMNPNVDEYLRSTRKFVVVAPKGVGKTLLLKLKSKQYRTSENHVFVPGRELCEKFERHESAFSSEELNKFTTHEQWKILWAITIISVVLRRCDISLPSPLSSIFPDKNSTIEGYLSRLLHHRSELYEYADLYRAELKPLLGELKNSVAVFIDAVDEIFEKHVGSSLKAYEQTGEKRMGALSADVWIGAQLGLLAAIRDIHLCNAHVKVFGTIRLEAFQKETSSLKLQLEDMCTILEYSDDELREIFEANIRLMDTDQLVAPNKTDPMERFLGFTRIPHWRVTDISGNPASEPVFGLILRHTFRRPRELIEMGKALSQLDPAARTPEKVREVITEIGGRLYEQYKLEAIPYWNDQYDLLFGLLKSNVLSRSAVTHIYGDFANINKNGPEHPFCYFYKRGLLGFVRQDRKMGTLIQEFLPAAKHAYEEQGDLVNSSYYLIHPCLETPIAHHTQEFEVDHYNIVGHGYQFSPRAVASLKLAFQTQGKRPLVHYGDHLIDNLSHKFNVNTAFFFACALAVRTKGSTTVSPEDVMSTMEMLVSGGVIRNKMGHSQENTVDYFLRFLTGKKTKDKKDLLKPINQAFHEIGKRPAISCEGNNLVFNLCPPEEINIEAISRTLSTDLRGV